MKRLIVVLTVFAIGVVLGFFAARSNPHAFEQVDVPDASALVRIARQQPYLIAPYKSLTDNEWDILIETERQVLQHPRIWEIAVTGLPELQAEEYTIEWLSDRLQVKQLDKSELLQVSFRHQDAHKAAAIVNAVVEAYLGEWVERNALQEKGKRLMLEDALRECEVKLEKHYDEIEQLSELISSRSSKVRIAELQLAVEEETLKALGHRIAVLRIERDLAPHPVDLIKKAEAP